ncbi:tRNA (adenosine(37)-N6)-dimethylallyltransferase MiaA [Candidatus Entotheonella palauensis]|uniref:tRNA (adenosine(37)-N6)-dimethylallyltransferase MiaA n=1 Tax=Candidatus Entotheonella palauensis TaxID=93172 RepID=UPI000B7E66CA|nr:tRNA (adenosine(37)-N6)-dimethylallyltransferase MiaA [Candidatus Entotheonella palauensis]
MTEPLTILVGPTAVGKTAISIPVAQALQAEILNVDSRQLYRHMQIGTAKPALAEQAQVRHHLLDLLAPDQTINAAAFVRAAEQALEDVRNRGKHPLIVAGSGLYLQALLYGLMPAPAAHAPLREVLRVYADRHGTPALHCWLQRLDAEAAADYHAHDRVRIVRALEVIFLTGVPFSTHRHRHRQQGPRYPYVAVGLTRCRPELYARIAARTEAMLAEGWLAEVKDLLSRGYDRSSHPMNSLGYRELLAYLEGQCSWPETVQAIVKATRQLAKRQLTWFRKLPHITWLNLSGLEEPVAVAQILEQVQRTALEPGFMTSHRGHLSSEDVAPQDRV